jgi:glutamate-1-semialdehyde 2,1-aminomutase
MPRDHQKLLQKLHQEYTQRFPRSQAAHVRANAVKVDGVSHDARSFDPFPFRVTAAQGAYVTDLDGHRIVDYWQGHYTNILGYNPALVRERLIADLQQGHGLQMGIPDERQIVFAETLAKATGTERVRLTTAGTLATMYAIMLARAFTGRKLVIKLAGGWHGANPMALKGVDRGAEGFDRVDSAGVSPSTGDEIIVTRFNDVETLRKLFRSLGDRIACFIFEPCMGGMGFLPASPEFMATARELTARYGALLILDEIITGFRYCAAGVQRLYGVQADLTTYGKIIGGGMPLVAVAGRADVLDMASRRSPRRVWFNGGTFSAHPLSLLAGQTMVEYLCANEAEVYPALAAKGQRLFQGIERVFAERGVLAHCTGYGNEVIQGGSLGSIYFPLQEGHAPTSAEEMTDPTVYDVPLREQALKLGLLLQDVNVVHGLGAVSMSHDDEAFAHTFAACDAFAQRIVQER